MNTIAAWLEALGLSKYSDVFATNAIDFDIVAELGELDLKELGIPLGDRKRLLRAIATLDKGVLVATDSDSDLAVGATSTTQAERRQLTVMFVDLVGSTALSGQLDPEDLSVIMRLYQNTVAGEINRLEGFVAKFMGDGVLAYFGWPRAHEDEAERAVRAGLAIVREVAKLKTPDDRSLAARIGIATGQVVVGDIIGEGSAQEETVVGETPNIAARLETLAEPGEVMISDSTRKLCGEVFEFEPLGAQSLKGVTEAVTVYRVGRERSLESRYQAQRSGAVLPLIGREHELAQIMTRWQQAKDGEGQMILLSGEAGIGKSRIMRAVGDALEHQLHYRINYQCSPYHSDSALYPAIQQLMRAAGFVAEDNNETRLDKLETLLRVTFTTPREQVPLIAALLNINSETRYDKLELTPQQQRTQTLQALLAQLTSLARHQPVLFAIEDAHWIDPTTLELIESTLDVLSQSNILLLITARPTFEHHFGGHPLATRVMLNQLGRDASMAIIARLSGGKALPQELLDEILRKTDGVPLFVEELTKTVLESGQLRKTATAYVLDVSLRSIDIPSSLHDSLMARLDRLKPIREVAQTAACIGREFNYRVLSAVSGLDDQTLQAALAQLTDAELVFQRGTPPQANYIFKHALVQDTAYASLLRSKRQQLHAAIAEVLQERFAQQIKDQPELIARHASEAGLAQQAAHFWWLAGERAAERAAYTEATGHFAKGLEQVKSIEEHSERLSASIKLNLGFASSLRVLDRSDEALQALEHAESAAKQSASVINLAEIAYLRGNLYFPLGRIDDCLTQHELSRDYARKAGASQLEARAQGGLGDAYYLSGRMITAARHFGRCVALSLKSGDELTAAAYGSMYGLARLYQNECQAALHDAKVGAERAKQTKQQRAEMLAYINIGQISLDMGKLEQAGDALETAVAYSRRLGARRLEAYALAKLSAVVGLEGRRDKACTMLEQACVISRESGVTFAGPAVLGKLARLTDDPAIRQKALQEGEDLLRQGCVSHCYFLFYRDAIETVLNTGDWHEAERYAAALEDYTRAEPLPWTDFFIARGRALAAYGRDHRDPAVLQELQRLRDEALRVGLLIAVPALEQAL